MNIDWNPVIHILDELSDGTHSLLELKYMAEHYDRSAFLDGLLFLADQALVELSDGQEPCSGFPKTDWSQRLREAFGDEAPQASLLTQTCIDLTSNGEQVLRLLNIGHPPLSKSISGN